ncbi:MAG: 2-hydroxyacyl-CoA dehydratase [Clostridia bacterium]
MENRVEFTKEMRKNYTIIAPNMLPMHFAFIERVFRDNGYNLEVLKNEGRSVVETGLKYVHNDTCYPALLVIGQMLDAVQSGKYDTDRLALMITQTGGGCRASNYIHLLRKALEKAGYAHIPVISLNLSGLEKNSGFKFTIPMLRKTLAGLAYADMFMLLRNQILPYEKVKNQTNEKVEKWSDEILKQFKKGQGLSIKDMQNNLNMMVQDFSTIEVNRTEKVRVGIVGEIYIKYASLGNNQLEDFLHKQDCEVFVPGLMSFILFKADNRLEDIRLYGGNKVKYKFIEKFYNYFEKIEKSFIDAIKPFKQFTIPSNYQHLKSLVQGVVGYGNKMGEGWLLTAEMMELCEHGYDNIVCAQPFGCLPNHIVGKGMIRKIKDKFPKSNIVAIDYDPGATKVNQENRIKLMLAVAKEKLKQK